MMNLLRLAFLVFAPALASASDFSFSQNCRDAYTCIFQMKFQQANRFLEIEKQVRPSNKMPLLLRNYIDFLVIMTTDEQAEFDSREGHFDDNIDTFEDCDQSSPYYKYSIAEARILHAIAKLRYGEYFTAAIELHRAKLLLEENQRSFPRFQLNMKWLGIIHCLVGAVPDDYRWVAELLGYHGDVDRGIGELRALLDPSLARTDAHIERVEILLVLAVIEANFTPDRGAIDGYLDRLAPECGRSPLVAYCAGLVATRAGKGERAVQLLSAAPRGKDYYPFHFLPYQLGIAKMNRLDPDASGCFEQFIREYRGRNYVKYAYQKLAWCSLLRGDKARYDACMEVIKQRGIADIDEDKLAQKEAAGGLVPNVALLKARLLFDGGFYTRALAVLADTRSKATCTTPRQRLEYTYRLGRINQELGRTEQAIDCYKSTIEAGGRESCYFVPNSALQLGVIHENLGKKNEAARYYNMVPLLATDEYRMSLNVKAKAYLNHIERKTP